MFIGDDALLSSETPYCTVQKQLSVWANFTFLSACKSTKNTCESLLSNTFELKKKVKVMPQEVFSVPNSNFGLACYRDLNLKRSKGFTKHFVYVTHLIIKL